MPIKKENFELYPHNWRKISWWIINIRAESRCEGILENGERCGARNHELHPVTGKKVVLSVAHLDHDPRNSDQDLPADAPLSKSNMRAFCQRCHNRWDREHRNESIKKTYRQKHGEEIPAAPIEERDEGRLFIDSYGDVNARQTIDSLKNTLRLLIKQMPSQEAIEHTILLKSLELQEEYFSLLSLSNKEISTPAIQAQLTVYRSKMAVIDKLRGLTRATKGTIDRISGEQAVDAGTPDTEAMAEDTNIRGLGIRKLLKGRRNGENT